MNAGFEKEAMMAQQWKQTRAAQQRVAAKEEAETKLTEAKTGYYERKPAEGAGRGEYFTPVYDQEGRVLAFDARRGQLVDPTTNEPVVQPTRGAAHAPELRGKVSEAQAVGKTRGEKVTTAKFDLPTVTNRADRVVQAIDDAIADPGLASATGAVLGRMPAIFGKQARAVSRVEQLKGSAFLEAFQMLKGGGHITEIEGEKAEQALARLNRAQTTGDFKDALTELRQTIIRGKDRARQQAGVKAEKPAAPALPSGWKVKVQK